MIVAITPYTEVYIQYRMFDDVKITENTTAFALYLCAIDGVKILPLDPIQESLTSGLKVDFSKFIFLYHEFVSFIDTFKRRLIRHNDELLTIIKSLDEVPKLREENEKLKKEISKLKSNSSCAYENERTDDYKKSMEMEAL